MAGGGTDVRKIKTLFYCPKCDKTYRTRKSYNVSKGLKVTCDKCGNGEHNILYLIPVERKI